MKNASRSNTVLYYGLPMLFCLAVHWMTLKTWFYGDDFAWLGLRFELHAPRDLIHILFQPQAQGTVRVLSERLFFLVFSSIFGLHAPPFRVWAFLTQFASIFLLIQITRRLTGSAAAGFLAPILWSANAGIAVALGWSSAYNEICFAFFTLLAFYLFLRYIDTGRRKYWIWQWVVFLLGFGALELNVMYPVLAACYALCCARTYLRRTLFLFIPSILFTIAHFIFVPAPTDPYYQMFFGSAPFAVLWGYWEWTLSGIRHPPVGWRRIWLCEAAVISISLALALFAWRKLRQGQRAPIFMLAWFLIVILPVLPLRNHVTEYYVTVPAIGLAMLGAWAIGESRGVFRTVAGGLAGLYLVLSIADIHRADKFIYGLGRNAKYLVGGVESLSKQQSAQEFFFAGIDNMTFWTAIYPNPFRLIGVSHVYLVPGSENGIDTHPEWGGLSPYTISAADAVVALKSRQGIVVRLEDRRLRDVTGLYLPGLEERAGREIDFVNVADSRFANRIGGGWYPVEGQFRWMGKTAGVKLPRPRKSGQVLKIAGFCPDVVLAQGPLQVSFRADGVTLGTETLKEPNQFSFEFKLPPELIGTSTMDLEIEVSRTVQVPNDPRTFGLVFGTFTLE